LHLFVVFVIGGVREIAFENLNGYSTATLWQLSSKRVGILREAGALCSAPAT